MASGSDPNLPKRYSGLLYVCMGNRNIPEMALALHYVEASQIITGALFMLKAQSTKEPVSYYYYRKPLIKMLNSQVTRVAIIDDDEDDYFIISDYISSIDGSEF